MIGRHISRARGRAMRAAGVPRLPNLPSGRAIAQRELRNATRLGARPARRRRAGSSADGSDGGPTNRLPNEPRNTPDDPYGDPYGDPSRDVGEGPDQLTRTQGLVLLAGVIIGVYLLSATCGSAVVSDDPPPPTHCHAMCEYEYEGR